MRLPRALDPAELRVLGALLEKAQTTPEYYPLTVKALVAACNQKSNRDPVTVYTEGDVRDALEGLRKDVLVWRTEGARSERWNESVTRRLDLEPAARALMTLLLLRGPQTPGELRSRSDRLHPFNSLGNVEDGLRGLTEGMEPLVEELPRQPGQKERRWTHLLGDPEVAAVPPAAWSSPAASSVSTSGNPLEARLAFLEDQVSSILEQLEELKAQVFGGSSPGEGSSGEGSLGEG